MLKLRVKDITSSVYSEWEGMHRYAECADDPYVDVRLVVGESSWEVATGDPSYDQWHGDQCGASTIDVSVVPTMSKARAIAKDLMAQVFDQQAMMEV